MNGISVSIMQPNPSRNAARYFSFEQRENPRSLFDIETSKASQEYTLLIISYCCGYCKEKMKFMFFCFHSLAKRAAAVKSC